MKPRVAPVLLAFAVLSCSDSTGPNGGTGNREFAILGHGELLHRFTSDLWVHGDYAYTGTWGTRTASGAQPGNTLYVWDIRDLTNIRMTDSVQVDARVVNDVKISPDGSFAVITHEHSSDKQNGITVLDLADPAHPEIVTRFTTGMQSGVHNVWVENRYVYVVLDGVGTGLRVMDLADRANPRVVSEYWAGSSFLHDVYVRDGLAFLSHWDAGLVILDVGNGIRGGTPESPVEVSRLEVSGGQTHNAWYWPNRNLIFVGEEDFNGGGDGDAVGVLHLVDVSDLRAPREIATYAIEGETPHNFWLDESSEVLYIGWYTKGIVALDVSDAHNAGLNPSQVDIDVLKYDQSGATCFSDLGGGSCSWAPQLHNGVLYVADANSGLWAFATP